MQSPIKNHRRAKWLGILSFLFVILIDWSFIFRLSQQADIITHWVIVAPIMVTFFCVISLFTCRGIYIARDIGFFAAYLIIILSFYLVVMSYQTIITSYTVSLLTLILLFMINFTVMVYLIICQIHMHRHHE